jgi:hypothetical protein
MYDEYHIYIYCMYDTYMIRPVVLLYVLYVRTFDTTVDTKLML